jgi:quinohemoprotein ethanol dehydrogenase
MQRMNLPLGPAIPWADCAMGPRAQTARSRKSIVRVAALMTLLVCTILCPLEPARAAGLPANVDAARVGQADNEPGNWLTYGRTYSEQRYSPLARITADNVK